MSSERPAVFVLGAERAHGLAITRSLGRQGISVVSLGHSATPGMKSRFARAVPLDGLNPDELLALLLRLGRSLPQPAVLLPTTDAHVLFISRHAHALEPFYRFTLPEPELLEHLADKRRQHVLAARCGIGIPRTWTPESASDLDEIAREISFPCVAKAAYSDEWLAYRMQCPARSRPGKVLVADTRESLHDAHELLASASAGVIVQELIGGGAENLYAVYAYCAEEGRATALFIRRKIRDWPVGFGSGSYSIGIEDDECESLARKLLAFTKYRGLANIEFKRDPRDGRLKMIEFNVRGASQLAAAVDSGVDLPFAAYADLCGLEFARADPRSSKLGVRWIDLGTDLLSAATLRKRGDLTRSGWLRDVLRARSFAYFALDDLRPGFARFSELLRGLLRR